jgi:A/G-specific adenine glycosylase
VRIRPGEPERPHEHEHERERTVADADVAAVIDWWTRHGRPLPWRASRDVYGVWVSEVMSVQTTVTRSAQTWVRWMERWPTVEALADASLAEVLAVWQGLGYPRRARDLHRSARIIVASGWPDELTDLPGVGAYIAAAIRCFAREEPVLPLDVNVRRVLRRRFPGGVDSSGDPWLAGQALMEFGQRICSARPLCAACLVRAACPSGEGRARVGEEAEERARRSRPFEGSIRQRRGNLLRQVVATGGVRVRDADQVAMTGLAQDGLVVLAHGWVRPPR